MRKFKKKMTTLCMIAMICFGLVCFSGCSFVEAFIAQQVFVIAGIFYVEYGDDIDQWFRELVFPSWAYGAYQEEVE